MQANPAPAITPLVTDCHGAGRILDCHPETVRRMAQRGELPSFYMGRSLKFSIEALREFVASQSRAKTDGGLVHLQERTA